MNFYLLSELIMKQLPVYLVSLCLLLTSITSFADISKAPALNLPGIDGDVDLVQLQGKVVYLDFWASWCDPCRESFPWMAEM